MPQAVTAHFFSLAGSFSASLAHRQSEGLRKFQPFVHTAAARAMTVNAYPARTRKCVLNAVVILPAPNDPPSVPASDQDLSESDEA